MKVREKGFRLECLGRAVREELDQKSIRDEIKIR